MVALGVRVFSGLCRKCTNHRLEGVSKMENTTRRKEHD